MHFLPDFPILNKLRSSKREILNFSTLSPCHLKDVTCLASISGNRCKVNKPPEGKSYSAEQKMLSQIYVVNCLRREETFKYPVRMSIAFKCKNSLISCAVEKPFYPHSWLQCRFARNRNVKLSLMLILFIFPDS